MKNIAFVDGQNLHMGTKTGDNPWEVDLVKCKTYLDDKYDIGEVYYFLGFFKEENAVLYNEIQKAGFILQFRKHNSAMIGNKKGNVDADIIFMVMKMLYKNSCFKKVVLISGDGDYKMLVDFLIEEGRFKKILFPNKEYASSLYKKLGRKYFANLEDVKIKIGK